MPFELNTPSEKAEELDRQVRDLRGKPEHMQGVARTLSVPALIVWGFDEAEIGMPKILEAVPVTKAGRSSATGVHGSSILFEDPSAWPALWSFLDSLAPAR